MAYMDAIVVLMLMSSCPSVGQMCLERSKYGQQDRPEFDYREILLEKNHAITFLKWNCISVGKIGLCGDAGYNERIHSGCWELLTSVADVSRILYVASL
jgi:hypothetical protein